MEPDVWTTGLIVAVMLIGLNMCAASPGTPNINETYIRSVDKQCQDSCPRNCSAIDIGSCGDVVKHTECAIFCLKTDACKDPIHTIQYYTKGYLLKTSSACPDDEIYELEENGARVKAAYPGCAEGIVFCQQPLAEAIHTKLSSATVFTKTELCPQVKREAECDSEVILCKCGDRQEHLAVLYTIGNKALYGEDCGDLGKVDLEAMKNNAGCSQSRGDLDGMNIKEPISSNNSSSNDNSNSNDNSSNSNTSSNAVTVSVGMPVLVTSLAMIPLLLLVR